VAAAEVVERLLEGHHVLVRDLELQIEAEELEVGSRHTAHQREQHASTNLVGGNEVRLGSLRRAADAAPDVELPGRVESADEGVELPARLVVGRVDEALLTCRARLATDLGEDLRARDADALARTVDARDGLAEVEVVLERGLHELS
jgi:hypothetical protein